MMFSWMIVSRNLQLHTEVFEDTMGVSANAHISQWVAFVVGDLLLTLKNKIVLLGSDISYIKAADCIYEYCVKNRVVQNSEFKLN